MEGAKVRILVADDHPMLREGLVSVLDTRPDFEVVGEAKDGEEAVRLAKRLAPDVMLLDLEMPGLDGVAVLERLKEDGAEVPAVVFTAYDTDERILGALRAGAKGYLLKGASRQEIFEAVRVVRSGGSLFGAAATSTLLRRVERGAEGTDAPTPRELEVLRLLSEGLSNRQMAERMFVTERTVKFHVSSLLDKLGAANRTEAVSIAVRRGLIRLPS